MSGLPAGWAKTKLDIFSLVTMGQSPKGEFVNQTGDGLPFYQGKAEFGKLYPVPRKYCIKPTRVAEAEDILMSIRAPVGPTNLCPEESCIGRGLASIRANTPDSQKYLLHYIRSIEPWLSQQGTGSTFKAISGKFLKEVDILVAPLNEQIRIANKLDSLLSKLQATQKRLDKIPTLLKRYRQSVLATAVSGELVTFPANSVETCLHQLGKLVGGKTPSKSNPDFWENGTIPWVSPKDMKVNNINDSMDKITDLALSKGMKLIRKNSLLMVTRSGILAHTFPVAVNTCEVTINQDIKAFTPNTTEVIPHFLWIVLKGSGYQILTDCSKTGTTVASIETHLLEKFKFILPPIKEQKQIVKRAEALFKLADQAEQHYQAAKQRTDKLTQSILAKAFRGELVPQDPNDEPASELLARIQAEKDK